MESRRHDPGDGAGSDRAAEIAALNCLLERLRRAVRVTVSDLDGRTLSTFSIDPPEPDPPPAAKAAPHPCRALILDILSDAHPRRLTRPEIMAEFPARGAEWSERTTQRHLDDLSEEGKIDNERDERGKGYGLLTG